MILGGIIVNGIRPGVLSTASAALAPEKDPELTALKTELNRLKGLVSDQSHAMADVAYHFAKLWFAGQKQNWPLAKFYLDETRSHLKWAVRIIPVRHTAAGDLDLGGILEAIDNSILSNLSQSIETQDGSRFEAAYRKSLEGCIRVTRLRKSPIYVRRFPS